MIGLDTNVLIRYLAQDDAAHARKVDFLIADALNSGEVLHLNDIVLCEMVWVLKAAYRMSKSTVVSAIDRILSTAIFSFDDRELLQGALTDYRSGTADFSDYLIGRRNARAGCRQTATFDRELRDVATFELM